MHGDTLGCCGGALESLAITTKHPEPGTVGVPEIVPSLLSERPRGRAVPVPSTQVTGGAPPLDCNAVLYGTLTVPFGTEVVVIVKAWTSIPTRVMVAEADAEVSEIESAVIVTVMPPDGGSVGAVYVVAAPLAVLVGDTAPHGAIEQVAVQLTPLFAESLATVAVICVAASACRVVVPCEIETLTAGGAIE